LLEEAKSGKQIRECTCDESKECMEDMTKQFQGCFSECFDKTAKNEGKKFIKDAAETKKCFTDKRLFVHKMIDCVQSDLNTCLKEKDENKKVEYVDINDLLEKGAEKLQKQVDLAFDALGTDGKEVVDIAMDVGKCMRTCFTKKNSDGYCFDKKGCQPKLESKETGSTIKNCLKSVEWTKHAHQTCECTVNSGVEEMDRWCQVIDTIASSKNPVPTAD
jgi:hypothetical protein